MPCASRCRCSTACSRNSRSNMTIWSANSTRQLSNGDPEAETAIAMRRKAIGDDQGAVAAGRRRRADRAEQSRAGKVSRLECATSVALLCLRIGSRFRRISAAFPDELLRRERDLYEHAIKTAAARPTPDPEENRQPSGASFAARCSRAVSRKASSACSMRRNVAPAQHAQYCEVTILLFREIGKLPPEDAAMVMRILMSGK